MMSLSHEDCKQHKKRDYVCLPSVASSQELAQSVATGWTQEFVR